MHPHRLWLRLRLHLSVPAIAAAVCLTIAEAHPGNGIVAVSDTVAITGDAVSNGIWRFESGKAPVRLVDKFHCHWVTKGRDGRLYAESLGERGGLWETSIYRLDAGGKPEAPVKSTVDSVHGVFLVDASDEIVHQAGNRLVVDAPGGGVKPFRGFGTTAEGVRKLAGIRAMAWGKDGSLYASDGDRILRARADGVLTEIATIEGQVVDRLYAGVDEKATVWGLAVDDDGTVYAAAPALGRVVKIGRDGKQETMARTEHGWAAIGVAVSGKTVFVLQSKTTDRSNYGPRVRILVPRGDARMLGEVNSEP